MCLFSILSCINLTILIPVLDPVGPEKNRLGPNKYNGAKGKNRGNFAFCFHP